MSAGPVLLQSLGNGVIFFVATVGAPAVPVLNHSVYVIERTTPTGQETNPSYQVPVYTTSALSVTMSQPLSTGTDGASPGGIPGYVAGEQEIDFYDATTGQRTSAEPVAAGDPIIATAHYNLGTDAYLNMAIGSALASIQPGAQPSFAAYNVALGSLAMQAVTTGNYLTAIGTSALKNNTSGVANTAVGTQALQSNTTGGNNTAVGQTALGTATTATENTAVGWESMVSCTTGGFNTAVGQNSLVNLTTGTNNVAVGVGAGSVVVGGGNNTHVGYQAGGTGSNFNNTTLIGKGTSATGAGAVAIGFDSSNNAATAAANVFALGTANHQVQVLNNTTGAGSAALGANCPAVTATAPYTWLKMMSGDGSTVYVPCWK